MTERENVDRVKAHLAKVAGGDLRAAKADLAPDVVLRMGGSGTGLPFAGTFRGEAGFERYATALREALEIRRFEPRAFTAAGDRVVLQGYSESTVRKTGQSYQMEWVMVFTLRDGKVSRLEHHYDSNAVVRAYEGRGSTVLDAEEGRSGLHLNG